MRVVGLAGGQLVASSPAMQENKNSAGAGTGGRLDAAGVDTPGGQGTSRIVPVSVATPSLPTVLALPRTARVALLAQCVPLDLHQEDAVWEHVVGRAGPGDRVSLASGYFNPSPMQARVLLAAAERGAAVHVLVPTPETSGFAGAKGIKGAVPSAYAVALELFRETARETGLLVETRRALHGGALGSTLGRKNGALGLKQGQGQGQGRGPGGIGKGGNGGRIPSGPAGCGGGVYLWEWAGEKAREDVKVGERTTLEGGANEDEEFHAKGLWVEFTPEGAGSAEATDEGSGVFLSALVGSSNLG